MVKKLTPVKRKPAARKSPARKRMSNPPARKRTPAKRAPAVRKRRYTRKANPPAPTLADGLGAVVGGALASMAGNLIAGIAGGGAATGRAIRLAVPAIAAMALGRSDSPVMRSAAVGAYGAAGVEALDLVAGVVAGTAGRATNPPIKMLRTSNPPPVRFANPFTTPAIGYPATASGDLRPGYLTPVPDPKVVNPYT
jgi:hypothetical protein